LKRSFEVATGRGVAPFEAAGRPDALERLLPGSGPWEIEVGFGKGRFLLARAASDPECRFLGIELAGEYFRLVARRLARHGLENVALVHGEALALLATTVPRALARAVHVYFPDPWPKSRHQRRRLFAPGSLDLVLGALAPGGRLAFATDHLEYGEAVAALLAGVPGLALRRLEGGWSEGARTNYEAKYVAEGRTIVRLEATLVGPLRRHPDANLALALGPGGHRAAAPPEDR